MKLIGLLFKEDDCFADKRIELLVGPMLLANARPVRFTNRNIDDKNLSVDGEWYIGRAWTPCAGVQPISIIDLTPPNSSRTLSESKLLEHIPHSKRIDWDRYELLNLLQADEEFMKHVVPCKELNDYCDVTDAIDQWGAIIIKGRSEEIGTGPMLVERSSSGWKIAEPYRQHELTDQQLRELVDSDLKGSAFIQCYQPSLSADARSYALLMTIQQRKDLAWMTPTMHCIVGTESTFASLRAGGEYIGPPVTQKGLRIIPSTGKDTSAGLNVRLHCFGISVARRIEELVGAPPCALALKVALDQANNPRLINIRARAAAPCRAARNLEFYKHVADFSIGLAEAPQKLSQREPTSSLPLAERMQPKMGLSIRTPIREHDVLNILKSHPEWIDLSLGNGGRTLLRNIDSAFAKKQFSERPYLSLRLGMASNDAALHQSNIPRLNALEDYVGRGLLRWAETRYMRSARIPLLQFQLDHALSLTENRTGVDMLWIDDFDLGMRALPARRCAEELKNLVAWLDNLCADGLVRGWGVSLFNGQNGDARNWIEQLAHLRGDNSYCSSACIKVAHFNTQLFDLLSRVEIGIVLLAANEQEYDWAGRSMPDVPILMQWGTLG